MFCGIDSILLLTCTKSTNKLNIWRNRRYLLDPMGFYTLYYDRIYDYPRHDHLTAIVQSYCQAMNSWNSISKWVSGLPFQTDHSKSIYNLFAAVTLLPLLFLPRYKHLLPKYSLPPGSHPCLKTVNFPYKHLLPETFRASISDRSLEKNLQSLRCCYFYFFLYEIKRKYLAPREIEPKIFALSARA